MDAHSVLGDAEFRSKDRPATIVRLSDPIAGDNALAFTDAKHPMAEGPSLIRYQGRWWLYWDEPAGSGINRATSSDLKTWTHRVDLAMPPGIHHGTVFYAPRSAIGWLR